MARRQRWPTLALRAIVSVSFLAVASFWVEWREALRAVVNLRMPYLIGPFILGIVGILLGAAKWWLLLDSIGYRSGYVRLVGLYWMGTFFNALLPGRTGGDVVRAYGLAGDTQSGTSATYSVVVDRAFNLVALVLMGLLAFCYARNDLPIGLRPEAHLWVLPPAAAVLAAVLVFRSRIWTRISRGRFGRLVGLLKEHTRSLVRRPAVLLACIALAVAYQVAMVASHCFIGKALDLDVPAATFFYLVPLTAIVSLLPITLNGLGLREGAFALLFAQVGVAPDTAVAMSLLAVGITAAISLIGGVWYVASGVRPSEASSVSACPEPGTRI